MNTTKNDDTNKIAKAALERLTASVERSHAMMREAGVSAPCAMGWYSEGRCYGLGFSVGREVDSVAGVLRHLATTVSLIFSPTAFVLVAEAWGLVVECGSREAAEGMMTLIRQGRMPSPSATESDKRKEILIAVRGTLTMTERAAAPLDKMVEGRRLHWMPAEISDEKLLFSLEVWDKGTQEAAKAKGFDIEQMRVMALVELTGMLGPKAVADMMRGAPIDSFDAEGGEGSSAGEN